MSTVISREALLALIDEWIGQGKRVAGPSELKPGLVMYVPLRSAAQVAFDGFIRPRNSIKEFVFPRHEPVCAYSIAGDSVDVTPCEPDATDQIVVGARPCDVASLPILDAVFNWDYKDGFYNARRDKTTIITFACAEHDDRCFCTSVGLGPDAERGSDVLLLPLGGGRFEVRCLTPRGEALFVGHGEPSNDTADLGQGPEPAFDAEMVRQFLQDNFDSPIYAEAALRCLGCGACAYSCPTCHCFDIVDEGNAAGGCRVKNWDSCQFGLFTHHASGHNPRHNQGQRQRQRVQHKFRIYPEKFGETLCTGCGNCTRNCPVGLGIINVLRAITEAVEPVEKT